MVKYCIGCGKNVEVNMFGIPKNGQEIWGHEVICDKCCSLVGIPQGIKGAFIASTYTKERFLKKYVEVCPDARSLLNAALEQRQQQKEIKNAEKAVKRQAAKAQHLREAKRAGCKERTQEKYTCCNCGENWYISDMDKMKNIYNATTSKLTLSQVRNLSQCPKCGSSANTHKTVKYWIDKKGNCVDIEE